MPTPPGLGLGPGSGQAVRSVPFVLLLILSPLISLGVVSAAECSGPNCTQSTVAASGAKNVLYLIVVWGLVLAMIRRQPDVPEADKPVTSTVF